MDLRTAWRVSFALAVAAGCQGQPFHVTAVFRPAPESAAALATMHPSPENYEGLRLTQVPEGIWIAGEPPMAIALPASQLAPLPGPGIYTRYGRNGEGGEASTYCASLSAPDACNDWLRRTERRRALLRQLVARRFELRGQSYVETRSTAAAKALAPVDRVLSPRRGLDVRLLKDGPGVLIPWAALPPRSELPMESVPIQIAIDPAKVVTLIVHLARPRQYRFTPCHLPLTAVIERLNQPDAELVPGFFVPQEADLLDTTYGWTDPHDYNFDVPGLILHTQKATFTELGEDEWVCGPQLKYRHGAAETGLQNVTDLLPFEIVRLPGDQGFLLASRPRSHAYSKNAIGGACAGEPAASWAIFHFKSLPLRPGTFYEHFQRVRGVHHLRLNCNSREPVDYEVELSPDLRTITEFEAHTKLPYSENPNWQRRTITWTDGKYVEGAWKPSDAPVCSLRRRKADRW